MGKKGKRSYKRVEQGRFAKASGQANERAIVWQASMIPDTILIPQNPQVVFLGNPNRPGNVRVTKRAFPDFILMTPSFVLVFDAKHTVNKNKYTPHVQHQFENMKKTILVGNPRIHAGYVTYWREHETGEIFLVKKEDEWPFRMTFGEGAYKSSDYNNWFRDIVGFLEEMR